MYLEEWAFMAEEDAARYEEAKSGKPAGGAAPRPKIGGMNMNAPIDEIRARLRDDFGAEMVEG